MRLSNEGFFLLDALLSVFILSCLCILCFTIYGLMERYEEGYHGKHYKSSFTRLLFSRLGWLRGLRCFWL